MNAEVLPERLEDLVDHNHTKPVTSVLKRGQVHATAFNEEKIALAFMRAGEASGKTKTESEAKDFAKKVMGKLEQERGNYKHSGRRIPGVEDVQDAIVEVCEDEITWDLVMDLKKEGTRTDPDRMYERLRPHIREIDSTVFFYSRYREQREEVRERLVALPFDLEFDSTDKQLQIHAAHSATAHKFNSEAIRTLILERTNVGYADATAATKRVGDFIANRGTEQEVTSDEIIAIIDAALMERGHRGDNLLGGRRVSMTIDDVIQIAGQKSKENSNVIKNNPEAFNLGIAELISKEYALRTIFDSAVTEAHATGRIHVHDLGYPERAYCSAHSVEFIKKFGLDILFSNLDAKSKPAQTPFVLNNHLHTFLASIQSNYAGALGFPMLNTLYASTLLRQVEMVEGWETFQAEDGTSQRVYRRLERDTLTKLLEDSDSGFEEKGSSTIFRRRTKKELKQIAQNLVFGASQSAFSRGGQTLFIDFNIDLDVPEHLRAVPALFPGAEYLTTRKNEKGEWEIVAKTDEEPERYAGIMVDVGHGPEPAKIVGDTIQPWDVEAYEKIRAEGKKIKGTDAVLVKPKSLEGLTTSTTSTTQTENVLMTYGHEMVREAAQDFAEAMLEVAGEGDKYSNPFNFPKFDVHVGRNTFEDPKQDALLRKSCEIVEKNDSVYFMFDRGDGMNVAQCCRLRERIVDPELLKHPEKMRFCGFQNVSINLPHAAFRAQYAEDATLEEKLESLFTEIDEAMLLGLRAHVNKKGHIQRSLDTDGYSLRTVGRPCDDGYPYLNLNKSTYIFGVVGLNEAVQRLIGQELHESAEAFQLGLRIVSHMYTTKAQFNEKYGLKFVIEETPVESANRRLAKLDQGNFPTEFSEVAKGSEKEDTVYYTNSAHLRPDAPVSGLDRAVMQAKTNPMIEAGAITHFFTGEKVNKANPVYDTVKAVYFNTQSSQIVFSGEHTICKNCGTHSRGLHDVCPICENSEQESLIQKTRVVGYFSDPRSCNKSKRGGELVDRQKAQAFYAGDAASVRDLQAELLESVIDDEEIRIGIIGTSDCPICKRDYEMAERFVAKLPDELRPRVKIVKYDVNNERDRVFAGIYDAPIDTFPTTIVHQGDHFARFTSEYPYAGTPDTLNTKKLGAMFESVVEDD